MVTSVNKQIIIPEELCEAPFPEANDERFGLPLLISDAGEEAAGERLFAAERNLTSALAFALNRGWDDGGVAFRYARRVVSEQDYRQDCEWDRWKPVCEEAGFEFRLTPRMRASAARFAEEYRRHRPDDGRKMAIVLYPGQCVRRSRRRCCPELQCRGYRWAGGPLGLRHLCGRGRDSAGR